MEGSELAVARLPLVASRAQYRRGRIFICLAALAWSTAGLLQRGLAADTTTQVAGRAFFAFLALLALTAVTERGSIWAAFRSIRPAGLGFALCAGLASAAFIVALNHTTVANVLFMQAGSPLVAAALARVLLGEVVTLRTLVAMLVALGGVGVMVGGPGGHSSGVVWALVMMLAFAVSLVFARRDRDRSLLPPTCLAQLLVFAVTAPFADLGGLGLHDLGLIAVLGVGQIGLGLAFFTLGARFVPAAEVALILLLELVFGPLWVWLADSERPSTGTLVGGLIVAVAIVVQATARPRPAEVG